MVVVYKHTRLDTDKVFYIGIGKDISRAYNKNNRSNWWKKVLSKSDYRVDIIFDDISYQEAIEVEKYLIRYYGRKDKGLGELVNMTDGGEGTETPTQHHIEAIIKSNKTRKYTQETLEKIKKHCRNYGEKNGMYGSKRVLGKNLNAKIVIDIETGVFYNSLKEVAILYDISYISLVKKLSGQNKNTTNFRYV